MELDVNGTIVANPTAADIVRAFDVRHFPEDWYIALETATTAFDALAQPDGGFFLSCDGKAGGRRKAEVDAATVKAVYLKALAGDESWQNECSWRNEPPRGKFVPDLRPLAGRSGDGPPPWAMAVVVAVVVLVGVIFAIEKLSRGAIRDHLPFGDSDVFWIGLIALPFVTLIGVAIASKIIEFRRAQSWVQTSGRVVRSSVEVRRHKFAGEPETVTNVPAVEYEFKVDGRTIRGTRIGIGDDAGGANLEATLARYPAGATVTVFYDPADPRSCVLERGGPQGLAGGATVAGCVGGLVLLAVLGGAIYWLVTSGPDFVRAHFPRAAADPQIPIFVTCFGLVLLFFFVGARRAFKRAADWPSVRGRIVTSEVESYQERDSDGRLETRYRPAVEFSYAVRGREYRGNQIKLGLAVAGSKDYAARVVAKYPAGTEIEVHYDPVDPTTAALENPTGATWIIAVAALGCFVLAAWQLGVFG